MRRRRKNISKGNKRKLEISSNKKYLINLLRGEKKRSNYRFKKKWDKQQDEEKKTKKDKKD